MNVKNRAMLVFMALIITTLLTGFLIGCEAENGDTGTITGSGKLTTIEKDFSDFDQIEAGPSFEIDLTQSDTYSISITTDENLIDYIVVSESGGTLELSLKGKTSLDFTSLIAEITMPTLAGLDFAASTQGTVQGFNSSSDLDIDLAASSSLVMNDISVGKITCNITTSSGVFGSVSADRAIFNISASGIVELEGSANDMTINASASSMAKLDNFPVENADITVSASSHAWIQATGTLDADVIASSYLRYLGEPTLGDIHVDDSSMIQQG